MTDDKWTRVEADHLDFDPLNDQPENLAPSCRRCNAARRQSKPRRRRRGKRCWTRSCPSYSKTEQCQHATPVQKG